MSAWQLPWAISKLTPSSACTPGNRFVMFLNSRNDMLCFDGKLLAQPARAVGGDAVHSGGYFPLCDHEIIDGPRKNLQPRPVQLSHKLRGDGKFPIKIHPIKPGRLGLLDQLRNRGKGMG